MKLLKHPIRSLTILLTSLMNVQIFATLTVPYKQFLIDEQYDLSQYMKS